MEDSDFRLGLIPRTWQLWPKIDRKISHLECLVLALLFTVNSTLTLAFHLGPKFMTTEMT